MLDIYRCPNQVPTDKSSAFATHYFAIVGSETVWPEGSGRSLGQIFDGTSKTLMVIEATAMGTHWMEPRDVSLDEAVVLLTTKPRSGHRHVHEGWLTRTFHETSSRNVAFCDGSVRWMGELEDADIAEALLCIRDNQLNPGKVPAEIDYRDYEKPAETRTEIKWGTVYALTLFVLLSMLPVWTTQRRAAEQK